MSRDGGSQAKPTDRHWPGLAIIILMAAAVFGAAGVAWSQRELLKPGEQGSLVEARLETDPTRREIILPAAVQWRFDPDGAFGPEIVADITVPERRQTIGLSIRKNADKELAASHIIEIVSEPPTFPGRRIVTIPAVSSKQGRYARGTRLIGAAATVAEGRFWFALSSERFDVNANRALLRDGKVIELVMVYDTGRLALVVFDIGESGKRVFEEAAALWSD